MDTRIANYLDRFINYNFLNKTKIYNELRFLQDQPNELILIQNTYHQLVIKQPPSSVWQLIFHTTDMEDVWPMAEIICSLGYFLLARFGQRGKISVYVSKLSPHELKSSVVVPRVFADGYVFLSRRSGPHYLSYVRMILFSTPKFALFFAPYVRWKNREPAFLVAMRYANGKYFHVLKLIAFFF